MSVHLINFNTWKMLNKFALYIFRLGTDRSTTRRVSPTVFNLTLQTSFAGLYSLRFCVIDVTGYKAIQFFNLKCEYKSDTVFTIQKVKRKNNKKSIRV